MLHNGITACIDRLTFAADAEAHYCLAYGLDQSGQSKAAVTEYQTAKSMSPAGVELYYDFGSLLLKVHRCSEAAAEFEKALKLCPDDLRVVFATATAYTCGGQLGKAFTMYGVAWDADPSNPKMYEKLGLLYGSLGDRQMETQLMDIAHTLGKAASLNANLKPKTHN